MILTKVLENDFHRGKPGIVPYMIEVPASADFLPAVVSNTRGDFLAVTKMVTGEDVPRIRVGIFEHEPEKIDLMIFPFVKVAFDLSKANKWENVFCGKTSADSAFKYIRKQSALDNQPHACLVPIEWSTDKVLNFLRRKKLTVPEIRFKKCCRVVSCNTPLPVFLSRPDYVGMMTYFAGGSFGIVLHNVRRGMAFCDVSGG